MDDWLVLGLLAAVAYGVAGLAAKVALSRQYLGLDVKSAALLTLTGIAVVFALFYLLTSAPKTTLTPTAIAVGISVGLFWALGQILVYYAFIKGADASRMAPIYNMNTLIVVVLAILLLRELPDKSAMLRVITGAILIVVGGILVSG